MAAECASLLERLGAPPTPGGQQVLIPANGVPSNGVRTSKDAHPNPVKTEKSTPKIPTPPRPDSAQDAQAPDDTGDPSYDAMRRSKWWLDRLNGAQASLPDGSTENLQFESTLDKLRLSIEKWPKVKEVWLDALCAARMEVLHSDSDEVNKFVLEKIDHGLRLLGYSPNAKRPVQNGEPVKMQ